MNYRRYVVKNEDVDSHFLSHSEIYGQIYLDISKSVKVQFLSSLRASEKRPKIHAKKTAYNESFIMECEITDKRGLVVWRSLGSDFGLQNLKESIVTAASFCYHRELIVF